MIFINVFSTVRRIYSAFIITTLTLSCTVVMAQTDSSKPYQSGESVGMLQSDVLDEVSGLAASRLHKGFLWVHNDSGDPGHVYLIDEKGSLKGVFNVNDYTVDCEDIAVGNGPKKNKSYVYLGDIGDNHAKRICVAVYRFPEPDIPSKVTKGKHGHRLQDVQKFLLKYPDGSRDAETLMADPVSKKIYVVTKREQSVHIYSAFLPDIPKDTIVMKAEGSIPFKRFVGGDISPDGSEILMKDYTDVYCWNRKKGTTIATALKGTPVQLPYQREKQGEAIGFSIDKKGYYTISEGKRSSIIFYKKTPALSATQTKQAK